MDLKTILPIVACIVLGILWCSVLFSDRNAGEDRNSLLTWSKDLDGAMLQARTQHKLVLVDVYATWCGWCKKLESDTFSDPIVAASLTKNFILVKMEADDHGAGQAFANKNGVRGLPTIIILDASGKVRGSITGYLSPADFMAKVKEIAGDDPAGSVKPPAH